MSFPTIAPQIREQREAESCAYQLYVACEDAVTNAGGRIIYDASLLHSDTMGCMIPNKTGRSTIVVSSEYDDIVLEALIMAHETGHFFDPTIVRLNGKQRTRREEAESEIVATGVALILANWFGLMDHCAQSWFDDQFTLHANNSKYFMESRAYYRRLDQAAMSVLPPQGQQWLYEWRNQPDALPVERTYWSRMSDKAQQFGDRLVNA